MKSLTRKEIDAMTVDQLGQMVQCTNDGQGDTTVNSVKKLRGWFLDENGIPLDDDEEPRPNAIAKTNSELIDLLWSDTNGNMTTFIWIENDSFETISFEEIKEYQYQY